MLVCVLELLVRGVGLDGHVVLFLRPMGLTQYETGFLVFYSNVGFISSPLILTWLNLLGSVPCFERPVAMKDLGGVVSLLRLN